jgi:hypothetical protein
MPSKTVLRHKAAEVERDDDAALAPGMAAFLDHIAEELALEYVRLMEKAARGDAGVVNNGEPVQRGR